MKYVPKNFTKAKKKIHQIGSASYCLNQLLKTFYPLDLKF